jgi:hypothetical protein
MFVNLFLVGGNPHQTSQKVEIERADDLDSLKIKVASRFNIVVPSGIDFQNQDGRQLLDIEDILDNPEAVGVLVDGHSIREPVSCSSSKKLRLYFANRLFDAVGAKGPPLCRCLLRGFP